MFRHLKAAIVFGTAAGILLLGSGCVFTPKGTTQEREAAEKAGRPYERPVQIREIPELPAAPGWREVLQHAFLSNGELESRYFEWQAALAKIDQAAGYPNTNVSLGYSYMFSGERMKSFDRQTFSVGFDPMQNLSFPTKVAQAGKVALDQARETGERFRAAKFDLQKRVISAYVEYALDAEKIRIGQRNLELLKLMVDTAQSRAAAGGRQQDLLKSQLAYRLAENELKRMEAALKQSRAMLNSLIGRTADAPLQAPGKLPEPRTIAADDARLMAVGRVENPELAALARQVQGRRDALELARQRWIPDVNPVAMFMGSASQSLGAAITLPTTIPIIRAAIEENRAMLRASEAMARQTRLDRAGEFVATLYALRDNERQIDFFKTRIIPAADQLMSASRQNYASGTVAFAELIDSQRTQLDVRLMFAEASAAREKRLAELERLAGTDIETLAGGWQ